MPYKDKEERRQYLRQYKIENREQLLARRRQLFAEKQSEKGSTYWTFGQRDKGFCLSCGGKAGCKPLDNCQEPRHLKSFESRKERSKIYRAGRRNECRINGEVYMQPTPEKAAERNKRDAVRRLEYKIAAHSKFGGKCENCGFADHRALELHHINRDGKDHRKILGSQYLRIICKTDTAELKKILQLLCSNCHQIITYEQVTNSGSKKAQ